MRGSFSPRKHIEEE